MKTLSFLLKPASSLCNMRCAYCFYADVSEHRQVKSYGMMTNDTVNALLLRAKEAAPDDVTFVFQGGEPTLAGLAFFDYFVSAAKTALDGITLHYAIQTNGILLDDAFIAFLKKEHFLVGLSLDGYREIHDYMRKQQGGKDSFRAVLDTYHRLIAAGVDTNILTVVTGPLAKRGEKLWQFYQKNGMDFVQFIPCLEALGEDTKESFALTPRLYGQYLKELFPLWANALKTGKYTSVRLFDNLVRQAAGKTPEMCGMCGRCSPQFVVEADGSVYPCDFYVLDEYRLGSVHTDSLDTMLSHEAMQAFLAPLLPKACADCRYVGFCRGGCKRYRTLYLKEEGYCPYADFLDACASDVAAACRFVFGK